MPNTTRHPEVSNILHVQLITSNAHYSSYIISPSFCQEPPVHTPGGRVKRDDQEECTGRSHWLPNAFTSFTGMWLNMQKFHGSLEILNFKSLKWKLRSPSDPVFCQPTVSQRTVKGIPLFAVHAVQPQLQKHVGHSHSRT